MNKNYQVTALRAVAEDIQRIFDYYSGTDITKANKLKDRFFKKFSSLKTNPERAKFIPELAQFAEYRYRELIDYPYRIFFRLEGNNVIVLAIIDGRRNINDLLVEIITRDRVN